LARPRIRPNTISRCKTISRLKSDFKIEILKKPEEKH